jgi:hypothetical protein
MRKSILLLVLSLVLLLTFGINVYAQNKEMTESVTITYYGTTKILPLGEGSVFLTYEGIGLIVSDTGEGLFQNATVRTLGANKIEKGVYKDERGWSVLTLQNGDKVFITYKIAGEVKPGGIGFGKGTATFTGGTGKAAGIKGSYEFTRTMVRSPLAAEGVGQNYTKGTMKYILP